MKTTAFNFPILRGLLRGLSLILLKLLGWRIEGNLPDTRKFVLIAAPHTSNWEAFYMIMVAFVFRVNLYWMGKHTLFKPPLGFLTRFLGGIPIDRSTSSDTVKQSISVINEASDIVLAVPPEGSRTKVSYWKTGFYYIALGAKVPIVTGYLDYGNKRTGVGPAITPSGDLESDFEKIRAFYEPITGKYPKETSITQLRNDK
ncbi:MAG TPA: lysophospholipid acyltransferase family protein [Desulfobacterales bacterium]|nr:lysophospholipid acyltransferase family protein [Desulfobacterales bacterium]